MTRQNVAGSGEVVRQLSSLDAQFLAIENGRQFAHVSGLAILDPADAPDGTVTLADIQELIVGRLPLLPPFRWKLEGVPLGLDHPYWIEDPDFDIDFHVRELALPPPGNDAQISAQVERLVARPLDRSRPLWELYVIQGLSGGRMALLTKIHHAVVDGVSGAEILGVLFDTEPTGRELTPQPSTGGSGRARSPLELLGRGVLRTPGRVMTAISDIPKTLPNLDDIAPIRGIPGVGMIGRISDWAHLAAVKDHDGHLLERPKARAPRTTLNGPISAQRHFSFGRLSLDTVKQVKNAYGVKVNDVVVALCAGAMRDFLISRDDLPAEPLIAMVPLSVRTEDEIGTFGNRVSAMVAPIPTDEADPVERLRRSHAEMSKAKDFYGALPADLMTEASNFIPPALFARAARTAAALGASSRFRPHFNLVISNIPGPPVPLYIAGAQLKSHYPVSVIFDGVGLNITVMSYLDQLDFGIVGDRELASDLSPILDSMARDLEELDDRRPKEKK